MILIKTELTTELTIVLTLFDLFLGVADSVVFFFCWFVYLLLF